ncbi:MAG: hypothetical protein OEW05_05130 [Candidatus Aminicenantes bacterium]|nr:hypothetical protein [Candidatus Aminicenantes bacterium]
MRKKRIAQAVVWLSLAVVLGCLGRGTGFAAPASEAPKGAGHAMLGWSMVDAAALNDRLTSFSYPRLSRGLLSLGCGGRLVFGRLVFGGEYHHLFQGKTEAENHKTSLSGAYGFFDLGAVLHRSPRILVYGLAGIGGGRLSLEMRATGGAPFDEVLTDPGRDATLSTYGFLTQLVAAADVRVTKRFFVGIRAGYVFAPSRAAWELGFEDVPSGPDARLTGPSLRVIFGRGSW